MICSPHVCTVSRGKRSCAKGMRSSAVHPSESIVVATFHTGSQDSSKFEPPIPKRSPFTPAGLMINLVWPR